VLEADKSIRVGHEVLLSQLPQAYGSSPCGMAKAFGLHRADLDIQTASRDLLDRQAALKPTGLFKFFRGTDFASTSASKKT